MKYVCIHGHFYQPPRENAWLEFVEYQDSAYPYHDWNERVNAESYAPNASSRILNKEGMITNIVNNYAKISFNFGPTLLSWMEQHDPKTYEAILEADKQSIEYFSGHGSAVAQAHSHLILPLANQRDKQTQVIWGIKDFEHRFQRKPEGMWLAETAVDTPTLEVLVDNGIKYTILAPRQAKAVRKLGASEWTHIAPTSVDPRKPYWCILPSGRKIALFFYDGNVAQDVAFRRLLDSGKNFAHRLVGTLSDKDLSPQLAHIATDGESYGHHHKKGDMALADAINHIETNHLAKLTNYGEYLEKFPPQDEAMIHENSSWSCVHGVERWRSNCGCNTGGESHWNQAWRAPLRNALDWLQSQLISVYEQEAGKILRDPWAARNDFIDVILDRSDRSIDTFLAKHKINEKVSHDERVTVLRLCQMQRNAMYMYTSCGWFFTEISGLETTQILQYACRTIYYVRQVANVDLEAEFIQRLSAAKSNIPKNKDGAEIYRKFVLPVEVSLERTGMHYAVLSLFEEFPETLEIFNNYLATSERYERYQAGRQKLAIGQTMIKSRITQSEKHFSFVVVYLGQQNIIGQISLDMSPSTFTQMTDHLVPAFRNSDISTVITLMDKYLGGKRYSMDDLFKDEKMKIISNLLKQNLVPIETSMRNIYYDNYHLLNALQKDYLPVRNEYKGILYYSVNTDLQEFLREKLLDINELKRIVHEFKKWDIRVQNKEATQLLVNQSIFKALNRLKDDIQNTSRIQRLNGIFDLLEEMDLHPEGWQVQNLFFSMTKQRASMGEKVYDKEWIDAFQKLGNHVNVKVKF
jgi:alpha-amylase/alpha-mannosidase (GH57 family)